MYVLASASSSTDGPSPSVGVASGVAGPAARRERRRAALYAGGAGCLLQLPTPCLQFTESGLDHPGIVLVDDVDETLRLRRRAIPGDHEAIIVRVQPRLGCRTQLTADPRHRVPDVIPDALDRLEIAA